MLETRLSWQTSVLVLEVPSPHSPPIKLLDITSSLDLVMAPFAHMIPVSIVEIHWYGHGNSTDHGLLMCTCNEAESENSLLVQSQAKSNYSSILSIQHSLTCSIQYDQPIRTIQAHTTEMRCLAVHEHAPVFATGSTSSSFKVWNMDGTHLSTSRHQSGFLHQGRTAGIAGLAFHPHAMVLAESGNMDGHVRLLNAQPV